ncbi:MAG TPA: DNA starvation/stationary phase protection protein [Jatrophihabitans sp.]|jgi:starvation-inducible DNA-binding protein|nr:DNA starvation/stationary phase protection protein [Jatrophihabitans sp.]
MPANAKLAPRSIEYTVPRIAKEDAAKVIGVLQDRLNALNDLALTLKHVHWNVVGPHFIAVHTMLDPQVDEVREMVDETAERIATLGGSPVGTPGALVSQREWSDYQIGRADAIEHMAALDVVYAGLIESQRAALDEIGELDRITEDMLIKQTGQLELFHWFVRAHVEKPGGELATAGAADEKSAARRVFGRR